MDYCSSSRSVEESYAVVGKLSPNLPLDCWMQGEENNIEDLRGNVILVEIFQLNCPGCFIYGLPEVLKINEKYKNRVKVIGLATAFEDFEINTKENLQIFLDEKKLFGQTKIQLEREKLDININFPVAVDKISKIEHTFSPTEIEKKILQIPDLQNYHEFPDEVQKEIFLKGLATKHEVIFFQTLKAAKQYETQTFEKFGLQGTPSILLIDKKGILRKRLIGIQENLETEIIKLLEEE